MYIVKNLKTILLLKCSLRVVLILVVPWVLFTFAVSCLFGCSSVNLVVHSSVSIWLLTLQ